MLDDNDIKEGNTVEITINEEKAKSIEINKERIKYTSEKLDVTIIEIKEEEDGISQYIDLDENDCKKDEKMFEFQYRNKSIYILHYPKGNLSISYGVINNLYN